ncbi:MAG: TIGR03790 family protein [Akkermansiaceae bacterium]|jgi:uncharacterized protein (TIGR03790 family)
MIRSLLLTLAIALPAIAAPQPLPSSQVVIAYNDKADGAKELAEFYAISRQIPPSQIVALSTTEKATIDRKTYEQTIRNPLRKKFVDAGWWTMGKDPTGIEIPLKTTVRCLVLMKGLPLRISRQDIPAEETAQQKQFSKNNESAIDSELTLMGVGKYPLGGPIPNPYFGKDYPAVDHPATYQLLVGRIDAPTYDHCQRMILDALDIEKIGLWGRTYIDVAQKGGGFAVGDKWMNNIAAQSIENGIPTVVERTKDTFVTNYPMTDAAIYFGWYTFHRNGPFLNPAMKFKKGAIAVHLHSFSAEQLTNPARNWSAALIDRGAAATLGNTWEPYLQVSHQFDIFYDRLLKGYSLIEAGSMSMNALSWQNIIIGDPLYRPYKMAAEKTQDFSSDLEFKALRYARAKWSDPTERYQELVKAADRMKSGTIYEALGYQSLELGNNEPAIEAFKKAGQLFTTPADQLRQLLNLVEIERRRKDSAAALKLLRAAKANIKNIPETTAIDGLITILDPPAPPPAKKSK